MDIKDKIRRAAAACVAWFARIIGRLGGTLREASDGMQSMNIHGREEIEVVSCKVKKIKVKKDVQPTASPKREIPDTVPEEP